MVSWDQIGLKADLVQEWHVGPAVGHILPVEHGLGHASTTASRLLGPESAGQLHLGQMRLGRWQDGICLHSLKC